MASPDPDVLRWAVREADPGAEVAQVRGLRDGGSPWLVRLERGGRARGVVLRVGGEGTAGLRTEVAALALALEHGLPAPRLPAADLAYWDVVAALSSPPDMGWFPEAIAGQGRPDLTRELLVGRRDEFLRAALDRLDAEAG